MTDQDFHDETDEVEKLAYVLPKASDVELRQSTRPNTIQGALDSMLSDEEDDAQVEEVFDVALGVRVSKKTSARVDYFASRLGMTKAVFLRQILNERLFEISHQMYSRGLLDEVKTRVLAEGLDDLIEEADQVMEFLNR